MSELEEQIKVVARARHEAVDLKDVVNTSKLLWETEHKTLLDSAVEAAQFQENEEILLRELTLQAYAETGDKAPAKGVGIRERTVLTYDGKVAFDWAKSHKMALQLDKKAFENIVKADTPDFVKVSTEAIATIATNLEV